VDCTFGYAMEETPGRASISLNSELILKHRPPVPVDPFETIWMVMLHEMCVSVESLKGISNFNSFPVNVLKCDLARLRDHLLWGVSWQ